MCALGIYTSRCGEVFFGRSSQKEVGPSSPKRLIVHPNSPLPLFGQIISGSRGSGMIVLKAECISSILLKLGQGLYNSSERGVRSAFRAFFRLDGGSSSDFESVGPVAAMVGYHASISFDAAAAFLPSPFLPALVTCFDGEIYAV